MTSRLFSVTEYGLIEKQGMGYTKKVKLLHVKQTDATQATN